MEVEHSLLQDKYVVLMASSLSENTHIPMMVRIVQPSGIVIYYWNGELYRVDTIAPYSRGVGTKIAWERKYW